MRRPFAATIMALTVLTALIGVGACGSRSQVRTGATAGTGRQSDERSQHSRSQPCRSPARPDLRRQLDRPDRDSRSVSVPASERGLSGRQRREDVRPWPRGPGGGPAVAQADPGGPGLHRQHLGLRRSARRTGGNAHSGRRQLRTQPAPVRPQFPGHPRHGDRPACHENPGNGMVFPLQRQSGPDRHVPAGQRGTRPALLVTGQRQPDPRPRLHRIPAGTRHHRTTGTRA